MTSDKIGICRLTGKTRYNRGVDVGDNSPGMGHMGGWTRVLPFKSNPGGDVLYGGNCLVN